MEVARTLRVIGADAAIVSGVSVGIGATAPRWPARWLDRDRGPLHLTRWDTADRYLRLGVPTLARRLPEAGSAFGGPSKRTMPRRSPEEIDRYLVEARRGEWVHWLSMLSVAPVAVVSPRWVTAMFAVTTAMVNAPFIAILRNNRLRLTAARTGGAGTGRAGAGGVGAVPGAGSPTA